MGAFKEMVIEIEQLQSAIDELCEKSEKAGTTLLPTEVLVEVANHNGLNVAKMISHWNYLNGGSREPYFPAEYLPTSLQKVK